jgi:tetratricopeptide (TPR) repeat protein
MKTYQITLIIIGFIFLALLAGNPSSEEHKEVIKKEINKSIENDNIATNEFQKLGQKLGESIGGVMIDNMVEITNFWIFSIAYSKVSKDPYSNTPSKPLTIGFFGKVFLLQKYDKDSKKFVTEFSDPDINRSGDYSEIRVQGDTAAVNDRINNVNSEIIYISQESNSLFDKGVELYYNKQDYANAESVLKKAFFADKNNYKSLIVLSDLSCNRYYTRNYDKALEYINKAIKIRPDLDTCYDQRGMVNLELGKKHNAMNDFNKSLEINSKYANSYYYRALIYGGEYGSDDKMVIDKNKACEDISSAIKLGMFGIDHYRNEFCK